MRLYKPRIDVQTTREVRALAGHPIVQTELTDCMKFLVQIRVGEGTIWVCNDTVTGVTKDEAIYNYAVRNQDDVSDRS